MRNGHSSCIWGLAGAALARHNAFALSALAGEFARTAHSFSLFTGPLLRRLLVEIPQLHFAEHTFTLQFLFQRAERLVNIVIAYEYLHVWFLAN